MKDYLFDTNIWSFWFQNDGGIVQKINGLANSNIFLSVIVWGEIIYGAKRDSSFSFKAFEAFIHSKKSPKMLSIDEHVAEVYGGLRQRLFLKFASNEKRRKGMRPEQLVDPVTSKEIGIQENDLWLVAQAIAYNLIFITHDKMKHIFAIIPNGFTYETWGTVK